MPFKPQRPCNKTGCPGLTREANGYCSKHQEFAKQKTRSRQRKYDEHRGSSSSRGYDAKWRKLRIQVKVRDDYLCVCSRCKEMRRVRPVTKSDPVHHIKPVDTHPHLKLDIDNCESHAFICHEVQEGRARDREYETWKAQREGAFESSQQSPCRPKGQVSTSFPT